MVGYVWIYRITVVIVIEAGIKIESQYNRLGLIVTAKYIKEVIKRYFIVLWR